MKNKMSQDKFPLEKLLTCSVRDYCDSKKVSLSDYKLVGVSVQDATDIPRGNAMLYFKKQIPEDAEAIVDLRCSQSGVGFSIFGTALIPKNK